MDLTLDKFADVRAYVFDYVVGVLWLSVAGVLFITPTMLSAGEGTLTSISNSAPSLHVPDLVLGFLLTIGGIIFPYCVAAAIKPLTSLLMTALDRLDGKVRSRFKRKSHQEANSKNDAHAVAGERVREALGWGGLPSRDILLTYLYAEDGSLANQIARAREEIWFRASATLPSALLFGVVVYRISTSWPLLTGMIVALIIFFVGVRYVNLELHNWHNSLNAAVILAQRRNADDSAVSAA